MCVSVFVCVGHKIGQKAYSWHKDPSVRQMWTHLSYQGLYALYSSMCRRIACIGFYTAYFPGRMMEMERTRLFRPWLAQNKTFDQPMYAPLSSQSNVIILLSDGMVPMCDLEKTESHIVKAYQYMYLFIDARCRCKSTVPIKAHWIYARS